MNPEANIVAVLHDFCHHTCALNHVVHSETARDALYSNGVSRLSCVPLDGWGTNGSNQESVVNLEDFNLTDDTLSKVFRAAHYNVLTDVVQSVGTHGPHIIRCPHKFTGVGTTSIASALDLRAGIADLVIIQGSTQADGFKDCCQVTR